MFNAYIASLKHLLGEVKCTKGCKGITVSQGINEVVSRIGKVKADNKKIFWVGNGGSAAIANHSALDYFRTADIKTQSFLDGSLLTCMGNDFGYQAVFQRPISLYAENNDLLVAISSSGKSENILLAVEAAKLKGCYVVTMSGFRDDNPLFVAGDVNFYVPKEHYGQVELTHGILCHSVLDIYMAKGEGDVRRFEN